MDVAFARLNLRNLRAIFYLVTPNETTFPHVDEVPRYVENATSWFIILIIAEIITLHFQRKEHSFALNDTITSISAGVLSLLFKLGGRVISLALYMYVYNHFRIVDLPVESSLTWFIGFLCQDLVYYLTHRAVHEAGVFWSFHQMHHSSEYYNLSTALRQACLADYGTILFDVLQSFIVPPPIFLVHRYMNLLYQFWIHTEIITSLGPLEYILNTPSHHRVHHGRNPYCIDKNYGGTLIIWDRLFGTFEAERDSERPIYGLVDNVKTFDQLYLQIITSLGPLEYILNTPSHHRVHHGRNPYCIDKNYGGTLIIWDRLFGTFEAERDSERPIYGLVDNVKTFDQLYLQFFEFKALGWDKGRLHDSEGKPLFPGLMNKIKAALWPPGYFIGSRTRQFFLWRSMVNPKEGVPEVDPREVKYNPELSGALKVYILVQFFCFLLSFLHFNDNRSTLSCTHSTIQIALMIAAMQSFGYFFDKKEWAKRFESLRLLCALLYALSLGKTIFAVVYTLSIFILIFLKYGKYPRE
ncbi:Alkylglycerol monooxygenase -like protein [Toxocara canis]|uniref:Alkylglycerol monooxygenase-like protein n=1 Tax=Toxocara canis TaxID=6265 RepID=A0A0B2V3T7_TOXCA|nr:Alkylglycerol monooxygenase -like protein [Toxocara canis]